MKAKKNTTNLILFFVLILLLFSISFDKPAQQYEIVRGYVSNLIENSQARYVSTKIAGFDGESTWKPGVKNNTEEQPLIAGQIGLIVNINTGDILFEKNPNTKSPIASLVKIMTAVVALEHKSIDSKIYVSEKAASIGENSMLISAGEVYTLEELLYGLILHSGNDSAYAIAEGVAGSSEIFVDWMNIKAKELGLTDTYFADPSGLDDNTYSTAVDLVKLTRYALKNSDFKKIVGTLEYEIPNTDEHKYIYLFNQTNLLSTYPGVAGVKTGFTDKAGLSLVTYVSNNGQELVGVVLNSIDRKGDMILMLDHSYYTLGVNIIHNLL